MAMMVLRSRSSLRLAATRRWCGYQFDTPPASALLERWPRTRANMVVNLVQEGENVVVERLGRFHAVHGPGWFLAPPFIDRLAYVIDMRERSLDVSSASSLLTLDNVAVRATATAFCAFVDARKAAYVSSNPLEAVRHEAQLALRGLVSERSLDDLLRNRQTLNDAVVDVLRDAAPAWGMDVRAFAVSEITPENRIVAEAMDRLALAEREQQHAKAESEGAADAARLEAETMRQTALTQAELEGARIAVEARARAETLRLYAQAEADATRVRAAAAADAIQTLAAVLGPDADREAAHRFVLQSESTRALVDFHQFQRDATPDATSPPEGFRTARRLGRSRRD
ncbi:hypothetical protein CTAYLR_006775 [Chrysophaeum taylorii]|uniref:Band 7 domain-containing protein n=1 Tax=Chrysophaeum taylorii TaxID=2483200 RepID=A0AAD7U6Q0_9STRA|nr:hypothetical protein CTAYLR_006775 [Chrysophaeum taylorii]